MYIINDEQNEKRDTYNHTFSLKNNKLTIFVFSDGKALVSLYIC